jgi:predicted lipoprotein with Yx(FWY)xxD motif
MDATIELVARLSIRVAATAVAGGLAICGAAALSANSETSSASNVNVAKTRLGAILVDARGRSLYFFVPESKNVIVCTSTFQGCTTLWPPLMTTGKPHAGRSVKASLLATVHRTKPAGLLVTYNGHPLYRYEYDKRPGNVNGQGEYGEWYVLSPSGKPIAKK